VVMFEHIKINPDRRKRAKRPLASAPRPPESNLDEVAVYTFPEVVMENGMPLVFKGTLRAAQEMRASALEAAVIRNKTTLKIGETALGETEERFTMGISDADRHPPIDPFIPEPLKESLTY
jgi:hypothetical protein